MEKQKVHELDSESVDTLVWMIKRGGRDRIMYKIIRSAEKNCSVLHNFNRVHTHRFHPEYKNCKTYDMGSVYAVFCRRDTKCALMLVRRKST